MKHSKVTAIIRCNVLRKVEEKLQEVGVAGISVSQVKGYGEYADFYSGDWMTCYARIEIFIDEQAADAIARVIMDTAHTGVEGDGIVAVVPVEKLFRIRDRSLLGAPTQEPHE